MESYLKFLFLKIFRRVLFVCTLIITQDKYLFKFIWRDYKSEYFNVSNGVKQGGVISPIFFSLYIDPLLLALKKSQI